MIHQIQHVEFGDREDKGATSYKTLKLLLPKALSERIDGIANLNGTHSHRDTFARALSVYEFLLREKDRRSRVYIQHSDGAFVELDLR